MTNNSQYPDIQVQAKNATRDPIAYTKLKLLSHHQQLTGAEVSTLKSYDWKPVTVVKIGDRPIPSADEAFSAWAKEIDQKREQAERWQMNDPAQFLSFAQAITQWWCCRHKTKRELTQFLLGIGFPGDYVTAEQISEAAYRQALECQKNRRRERNKRRMHEKRNPQVKQ